MGTYITSLLIGADPAEGAGRLGFSGVCAALWVAWGEHLARWMLDPLVLVVTVLWALDWLTGGLLAWRQRRYSARRGLYSIVKWLIWMGAIGVGWAFQRDGLAGDDIVPVMIGAAVVWTEGISVLRNLALLAGRQGGILSRTVDGLEGECSFYFERWEASRRKRRRAAGLPETEGPDEGPSSVPGGDRP
jgi:phage-related holin